MSQTWKYVIVYRRPGTNTLGQWVGTGRSIEEAIEECKAKFLERNLRELPESNITHVTVEEV